MASNSFCNPRPAALSPTRVLYASLLISTLCLPSLFGQSSPAGYLAVGDPAKVAGARNAEVQTKIPVTVRVGYHVNSNTPSDDYLIPLKLTWTDTGALQGGTVTYPKPSMEKYEFSEKPLSVFTGNFDLVATFKVASNAPAGPGVAVGKLKYQACSNKACYAPKVVDITIPYQVK